MTTQSGLNCKLAIGAIRIAECCQLGLIRGSQCEEVSSPTTTPIKVAPRPNEASILGGIFKSEFGGRGRATAAVPTSKPGEESASSSSSSPPQINPPVTEGASSSSPSLQTMSVSDPILPSSTTSPKPSVTGGARSLPSQTMSVSDPILPSPTTSANPPITGGAGSSPSFQIMSVSPPILTSPTTSANPPVTEDAGSSSSSPKLNIILPSVICSLVLLVIIFVIMSCCYHRTKRPRSTTMSDVVRDAAEPSLSDPNIIHPYDLKIDDQVLQPHVPELFPGESTQTRPNDLDSIIVGRRGIFERLLWRNGTNHSELPRPYELKGDLLPLASQDAALTSKTQPNRASISPSPSISRPRPRSVAQTESTGRQIRLREKADALRSQVSGYERDTLVARDEEIRRLREHIQILEIQDNSHWARGLTDDPPPSYRA
ncbi:hypothetical protein D9758_009068 [Tetrapyrgos nigripes]|uniref:Uncharacterized protein n=1 Tax=Tetrapyrgos nigripes TaxID=182062 RepID=A0A8H5GAF5_9AGAR|nr:hypothetical protein D9758_009068 [Tetrapyrgos nigripes]